MSVSKHQRAIFKSLEQYERRLSQIDDEAFQQSPDNGGWSYSEVYSHILQANIGSLLAIEKCINGTGKVGHRITLPGFMVLLFRRFPPVKIKAPEKLAAMVAKISKEDAYNLLIKFKDKLEEVSPQIIKASSDQKVRHPRLGFLNARQWFSFIELHSRHHQKQLDRISTSLKSKTN